MISEDDLQSQVKDVRVFMEFFFDRILTASSADWEKLIMGRTDLRGYSSGKYRADQKYTIQAEYRWTFYKKFGMVVFAGIA